MNASSSAATLRPVRVWDLPTRVFHWALALAVIGAIASAKIGGNAMVWHFRAGWLVLALLVFRAVWGLVGGHWSRFASFIYSPITLLRYLRGQGGAREHLDVGHNPLGALSVFALLAILAVQVATGLVADDEIANIGPLNRFVSSATVLSATGWHKGYGSYVIFALVGLHVAAILFYLVKSKINLIGPMLGGDKLLPADVPAATDTLATRALATVLLLAALAFAGWVFSLGG